MAGLAGSQPQNLAPVVPNQFEAPKMGTPPKKEFQVPVAGEQVSLEPSAFAPSPVPEELAQAPSTGMDDMEQFMTGPSQTDMSDMEQFMETPSLGRQALEATYEAIPEMGGLAGGVIGATGGPLGAVAGSAAGYTFATGAKQLMDQYFRGRPPKAVTEIAQELAMAPISGAMQEMGGQIAGKAIGAAAKVAQGLGESGATLPVTKAGEAATAKAVSRFGNVVSDEQKLGLLQHVINKFVPPPAIETAATAGVPEQKLITNMQSALETNEAARKAGVSLLPHELHPLDPVLSEMHASSLGSKEFQEFSIARANAIKTMVEDMGNSFQTAGKTAKDAVKSATTADRFYGKELEQLRSKVIANSEAPTRELFEQPAIPRKQTWLTYLPQADQVRKTMPEHPRFKGIQEATAKAQQQRMGEMTAGEISSLGQQASWLPGKVKTMQSPHLQQLLPTLQERFGLKPTGTGSFSLPNLAERRNMAYKMNMSLDDVNGLIGDINKLSLQVQRNAGNFTPRQLERLRQQFANAANASAPGATEKASVKFINMVKLKDAIRDDFVNGMGNFLDTPAEKEAFNVARQRYHELKSLPAGVDKLLAKDSPATYDIVNWLNKGAEANMSNILGLKKAVTMESPEAWQAVAQEYTNNLFNQYAFSKTDKLGQRIGGYDWARMSKSLRESGPMTERLEAIVGKEKAQAIKDLAMAGTAIQEQAGKEFSNPAGVLKYMKAVSKIVQLNPQEAIDLISADHAARKLLGDPRAYRLMPKDEAVAVNSVYHSAMGRILSGGYNATARVPPDQESSPVK